MKFANTLVQVLGLSLGAWSLDRQPKYARTEKSPISMKGFFLRETEPTSDPSFDRTTLRFSRLRRLKSDSAQHPSLASMHSAHRPANPLTFSSHDHDHDHGHGHGHDHGEPVQNISTVGDFSTQYAIQCQWDGADIWLLFDTGSSDTWAAKAGFKCHDDTGKVHGQAACALGEPYIEDFAHGTIDDLHFNLRYGSGERVSGPMGYSDLSCGGLDVKRQQVGLANNTYWHGNNVTNGMLGLAYPSLTNAYYGKVGDEAPWNAVQYPPFFTTAVAQGTIDPVFSVAIARNSSDGIMAWGGLPPLPFDRTINATSELLIANLIGQDDTAWKPSFYTIVPNGLKWGTTTDEADYPYIVDTGTTMIYVPPPLAEAIARSFQPEAVYLYQWDAYFVDCNAVPPEFAVIIEDTEFWINPADLIYRDLVDPLTGYCAIGIASGGEGPYILGDVFLQNVVAVFDIGGGQMRFYSRK